MKNINIFLLLMGAMLTITVFSSNSGGRTAAGSPRTGAPSTGGGIEGTCSQCHSSGSATFGEPLVTWTIADGDGANVTSYVPGQTYNVTVAVTTPNATTAPSAYGFNAVFLDDTESPNGATAMTAGSFANLGANLQVTPFDGRSYLEQDDRTPSGVWTFDWTAPVAGFGEVRIYSTGNAVNSNFSTGGDSGSTFSTVVSLTESATMPVTLTSFTAEAIKNTAVLDWETALEENVSHFTLERSFDRGSFVPVMEQSAKASSGATYRIEDTNLSTGSYAYRLRIEDLDGTFAFSPTVSLSIEADNLLTVYPNPSTGSLTISTGKTASQLRLLDGNGRVIHDNLTPGQQNFTGLISGIYLLEATSAHGRTVKRVVIR